MEAPVKESAVSTDEVYKKLDNEYINPHLRTGETVRVRISSTTSTRGFARFLDALGPFAILVEAWFSRPTFVALTDQRLIFSAVTILRQEPPVESIELSDLWTVHMGRGLFHKHLTIRAADDRRFRVTAASWSPFKEQRDGMHELFEALTSGFAPQPA
jgi:hypothetical protein